MSRKFPKVPLNFSLKKKERKILKAARELIETKSAHAICFALNSARETGIAECRISSDSKVINRLKSHIMTSLDGVPCLEAWHGVHRSKEKCRKDRLAWIDYMLKN